MEPIVVIGSLNMDLVVKAAHMPAPGETVRGERFEMVPGGKGANQAAAIALLGWPAALVGRVGRDAFGPRLVENLARQGVDTAHIALDADAATGVALIIVDQAGQNSIVVAVGANGRVSPADVDAADELLRRAPFLVLQFEIPLETVAYAVRKAGHYGVPVILNPAPAAPMPAGLLRDVRYLVPNESEARYLTDLEVGDLASAERAARELQKGGVPTVIVTLGEKGALAVSGQEAFHVPAPRVEAVDTTAAGDAFIGGLAVALSRGMALKEAVRFANCAGALAVTRFGAQTSLPKGEEVEALYRRV